MSQTLPDLPTTDSPTPPADPALAAARAELATLKSTLAAAERRHALDLALIKAGAIDPESAAAVAATLPGASSTDPAQLAADLRRSKPFLFSHPRTTQTAAPISPDPAPIESAAAQARDTGDRRSLLHYLRLRRTTPP